MRLEGNIRAAYNGVENGIYTRNTKISHQFELLYILRTCPAFPNLLPLH